MTHYVYVLFDDAGVFYVGCTKNLKGRLVHHRKPSSPICERARGGDIRHVGTFPDRASGVAAEKTLTRNCREAGCILLNIMDGNTPTDEMNAHNSKAQIAIGNKPPSRLGIAHTDEVRDVIGAHSQAMHDNWTDEQRAARGDAIRTSKRERFVASWADATPDELFDPLLKNITQDELTFARRMRGMTKDGRYLTLRNLGWTGSYSFHPRKQITIAVQCMRDKQDDKQS